MCGHTSLGTAAGPHSGGFKVDMEQSVPLLRGKGTNKVIFMPGLWLLALLGVFKADFASNGTQHIYMNLSSKLY
jgi:hypothetical protein